MTSAGDYDFHVELEHAVTGETRTELIVGDEFTLGRASTNSIVLSDPSVADEHVTVRGNAGRIWVTNLTSDGVTAVEDGALEPDASASLSARGGKFQVGRYRVTIRRESHTMTFAEAIEPSVIEGLGLLVVESSRSGVTIRLGGAPVALGELGERFLRRLAHEPDQPVRHVALQRALSDERPADLVALASRVRRGLARALDDEVAHSRLTAALGLPDGLGPDQIAADLIVAHRGVGYRLALPATMVSAE